MELELKQLLLQLMLMLQLELKLELIVQQSNLKILQFEQRLHQQELAQRRQQGQLLLLLVPLLVPLRLEQRLPFS